METVIACSVVQLLLPSLLCHLARRPFMHSFGQSLIRAGLEPRPIRSVAADFFNNPMFEFGHTLEALADGFRHRYSVLDCLRPPI